MNAYKIPIGDTIEVVIDFFVNHFSFATRAFSGLTENGIRLLVDGMMAFPAWVLILMFAALA